MKAYLLNVLLVVPFLVFPSFSFGVEYKCQLKVIETVPVQYEDIVFNPHLLDRLPETKDSDGVKVIHNEFPVDNISFDTDDVQDCNGTEEVNRCFVSIRGQFAKGGSTKYGFVYSSIDKYQKSNLIHGVLGIMVVQKGDGSRGFVVHFLNDRGHSSIPLPNDGQHYRARDYIETYFNEKDGVELNPSITSRLSWDFYFRESDGMPRVKQSFKHEQKLLCQST